MRILRYTRFLVTVATKKKKKEKKNNGTALLPVTFTHTKKDDIRFILVHIRYRYISKS